MRISVLVPLSLVSLACSSEPSSPPPAEPIASSDPPAAHETPMDARFTETLLAAASDYESWSRVDERPSVAPTDCAAPTSLDGVASRVRLSAAEDAPHGDKLYFLFAGLGKQSARQQYTAIGNPGAEPIPVGFAIVKQSWTAVSDPAPVADAVPHVVTWPATPPPITWIEHEGRRLHTGERADLFVMAKVGAADMPGTDAGWIYGTLTPDGRSVTSAGRVQSCMDCHEAAPHDRLFGLRK